MSATTAELSFTEMLDANERETAKWQDWFEHQPAEVLDLPLDIALAEDVREFLLHIFAVELRYAERLTGSAVTEYEALPTGSVGELFATGERARKLYREYFPARPMPTWPRHGVSHAHRWCAARQQAQDVRACHAARSTTLGAARHRAARKRARH